MRLLYLFLFFLCACRLNYTDWYNPSDPEKLKEFLVKNNILRHNCQGQVEEEATIYALIDWTRLNLSHSEGDSYPGQKSILDVINEGEEQGYILIDGCDGTADFYKKVLGSVGIETVTTVLNITNELHISIDFPGLDKGALHADQLHAVRFTKEGKDVAISNIPSEKLLVPLDFKYKNGTKEYRDYYENLMKIYRPSFNVFFRALNGGYGQYVSGQYIEESDKGQIKEPLPWSMGVLSTDALIELDKEIDRLGGPKKTIEVLDKLIIYQNLNKKIIPLDLNKKFKGECGY